MGARIYYACQNVEINGPSGDKVAKNPVYDTVLGLQSVGLNTNYNLEPTYQLGQLSLYDNYEEIPEVEISLNKVLDGSQTIFAMAMGTGYITDIANNRCSVRLSLFPDTTQLATGVPTSQVVCAPAYLSQVTYTFPTEGNFTEDATLVSNNKVWITGVSILPVSDTLSTSGNRSPSYTIMRRGQLDLTNSTFPSGSGGGALPPGAKITNITVTINLGREELRSLGQRTPYLRYVNFPLELTTEIEVQARDGGDYVGAAEGDGCFVAKALGNQSIAIATCDGMVIDLGDKNKLTSVNFQGGDTGGGNATITYSYQTFNDLHYKAPTSGLQTIALTIEDSLPTGPTDFTF